jgi:hypothetical protein
MKRLVLFAVVLGTLFITSQVSDAAKLLDQYLCVTEKRIGFGDDNRLYADSAATVQAVKNFLISTASSQDFHVIFFITEAGEPRPSGHCEYGFNDWGILFCDIRTAQFKFNKYNGRFITVFTGGYDEFPYRAYMETGKCSSLRP